MAASGASVGPKGAGVGRRTAPGGGASKGVRSLALAGAGEVWASLTHYAPGLRQQKHEHGHHQISFLLAGEVREEQGRREFEPPVASMGCKPLGLAHADLFGPSGALLFSVQLRAPSPPGHLRAGWAPVAAGRELTRLVRAALEAGGPLDRADVLWDLLSLDRADAAPEGGRPPPWLERVRDELREAPEGARIDRAALEAGVHRVHLARAFRLHYGVSPSAYRRRCLAARALARALERRETLARTASEVGFYDQSHLARAVRGDTGLPLSRLLALLP
jgi:AraC family transcriptional regulator